MNNEPYFDQVWVNTPMPKDYTCSCGLYVHPSKRNPRAIHMESCAYCMKYRLYYWFQGTPQSRVGGPWWYRDFDSGVERDSYLHDTKPFLHAYSMVDGQDLPKHPPMEISPAIHLSVMCRAKDGWEVFGDKS